MELSILSWKGLKLRPNKIASTPPTPVSAVADVQHRPFTQRLAARLPHPALPLVLGALALPWVLPFLSDDPHVAGVWAVMGLAFSLGVGGLGALYRWWRPIWEWELVQLVTGQWAYRRLAFWAGLGFSFFALGGGTVLVAESMAIWTDVPFRWGWLGWSLLAGVWVWLVWSLGVYWLYGYGRQTLRHGQIPLFLNEAALVQRVESLANGRLRRRVRRPDSLTLQTLDFSRTLQAGLELHLQTTCPTEAVAKGHYLQETQSWHVVADRRGQLVSLAPAGPLSYQIDPDRPYTPPPVERPPVEPPPPALQGELLSGSQPTSASMKEAVICAVVAASYKR